MIPNMSLSGERFTVVYRIQADDQIEARARAEALCLEQTVECPSALLPSGSVAEAMVGRIEDLRCSSHDACTATISFAVETIGAEFTQFLNVLFGNSSLKPGLRVESLSLPKTVSRLFKGPRFGPSGLRAITGVARRPLVCTALKPLGLPATALAEMAYRFAWGGIDLIKDDHGLADQTVAPFAERLARCAEAVARANQETGGRCLYLPNVTAPFDHVLPRARAARAAGAGGLLVAPGLVGWETLRRLAEDDSIGVNPNSGLSPYVLFGQLPRLAGADASIYPHWGGRFSFSTNDCRAIVAGARVDMGSVRPLMPAPGGGMGFDRLPDMVEVYGSDVILLIGGALQQRGPDLTANARYFREKIDTWETR
ncbi:MAG: ribulose 1 5-bisphosphate carboxylase large subunit [Rhodospirillaceae bacterium]|nr:MAG: ribulose 1 5-bisphosphate carboxylase large subunit [Rhodospirillaceae bacterium]